MKILRLPQDFHIFEGLPVPERPASAFCFEWDGGGLAAKVGRHGVDATKRDRSAIHPLDFSTGAATPIARWTRAHRSNRNGRLAQRTQTSGAKRRLGVSVTPNTLLIVVVEV